MGHLYDVATEGTFTPFTDVEQSLCQRFECQVSKYPERIAVKTRDHAVSYDTLNRYANRIGSALLSVRGTAEETIGLLLEKNAGLAAACLGTLKAGRVYVALDRGHPRARLSKMLEDAQISLILTDSKNALVASELAGCGRELLNIEELDSGLSEANPGLAISPDQAAYIVYTSGSTGEPKGVIQTHRNVLHRTKRHTNGLKISADDRLTFFSSAGSGSATSDIYGALLNGAGLYPFNVKEEGFERLAAWVKQEEITIYHSTASLFRYFLGAAEGRQEYPSVRVIRLGTELVHKKDVELFKLHFSRDCVFVNALASNEAGVVRQFVITKEIPVNYSTVPVGFAVDDMEVLLLDDAGEPVSAGSTGEITIRSRYITPGYWRKPELTSRVLFPDPAGGDKRIFRTGDMGRMTPDGCLEYLGRRDLQVKIRGYTVEVGEVEAALLDLEQVKEAAVIAGKSNAGENQLVAYIVASQSEQALTSEKLRVFLRHRLPEYMLPTRFVFLESLPLKPNGKVNPEALLESTESSSELPKAFVAPRDGIELRLAQIWEKVLQVHPAAVGDDFFELGGHSLTATQMFLEVEKSFGRKLSATTIFETPTIEKLANILRLDGCATPSQALLLQAGGAQKPFFCVPAPNGTVFTYLELARSLGAERPVYGLQLPAEDAKTHIPQAFRSTEEMASDYVRQLHSVQPSGPYLLGGHSAGGLVAFEMAQQLRAAGEDVELLALFDSLYPGYLQWMPSRYGMHAWAQKVSYHLRRVMGLKFRDQPVHVWRICVDLKNAAKRKMWRLAVRVLRNPGIAEQAAKSRGTRMGWRSRDYAPRPYSGRVTLFKARDLGPARPYLESDLSWTKVAKGGIDIYEIPGDHVTMLAKPQVESLAGRLNACLKKATARETVEDSATARSMRPSEVS